MERTNTPHAHRIDEGDTLHIRIGEGGHVIAMSVKRDTEGDLFFEFAGVDCNLDGAEPGLYYPVPVD